MSLLLWGKGGHSDQVTGLNWDKPVGWTTVNSLPGEGPPYHAMGMRGRLRFDRSLPRRGYVLLRRKGSQVKQ